jgi:hypothetical protein
MTLSSRVGTCSSMAERYESAVDERSEVEEGVRDRERVESDSRAENWTMVRGSVRVSPRVGDSFLMSGQLQLTQQTSRGSEINNIMRERN